MSEKAVQDILLRIGITGDKSVDDLKKRNIDLLKSIIDTQKQIDELNKSNKELSKAEGDNTQAIAENIAQMNELKEANKVNNTQLNQNITLITSEMGSLKEKRAQLSVITAEYTKMSSAEKTGSEHGIALGKAVKDLTEDLKAEEKQIGQTYRNVGNYTDSIIEANNQMGLGNTMMGRAVTMYKGYKDSAAEASGGTGMLNGAMKMLAANPLMAVIAVAAVIFMTLKEAIGRNAEIMDKLSFAMAPVKEILGFIFGAIAKFVDGVMTGFIEGMKVISSLFGDAGAAANEYVSRLEAAEVAEKKLYNLNILKKKDQQEINDLMAVANNRMVDGTARREAIMKSIQMETEMATKQAEQQKIIHDGEVADLEAKYDLKGKLSKKDGQLTQEGLDKMSTDDKAKYAESLGKLQDFNNTESEIRKVAGKKLGTISKAIIADEKADRDILIAAMPEGEAKKLAIINSNLLAQKATTKTSIDEQAALIKSDYARQIKELEGFGIAQQGARVKMYLELGKLDKEKKEKDKQEEAATQVEINKVKSDTATKFRDEQKALQQKTQDILTGIIKDNGEKELQTITNTYDREHEAIKGKTEAANQLRKALNEKYITDVETTNKKFSDESIKNKIDAAQKEIELKLAVIKKGSDAELALKLEAMKIQMDLEVNQIGISESTKNLIIAKYKKAGEDETAAHDLEVKNKLIADQQLEFQNEITQMQLDGQSTLQVELDNETARGAALQQKEGEKDAEFLSRKLSHEQSMSEIRKKIHEDEIAKIEMQQQIAEQIFSGLNSLIDIFGKNTEEGAAFAKAIGLFQIGVDTATAIASLTANSEANPTNAFTFGGAGILQFVSGMARILSNIAKAKSLLSTPTPKAPKAQGFATGGNVFGAGSGTSDSIPAYLSNGESVNNTMSTGMFAPLYSALNQAGGGVPIQSVNKAAEVNGEMFMANAFSRALREMPAPIATWEEWNKVDKRVRLIESMARH
ncbi:MAG: hypothetical protein ACOYLE_09615 [Bacteroidales bacterium]